MEKLKELQHETMIIKAKIKEHEDIIAEYNKQIDLLSTKAKNLLPKGYWYTREIDANWHKPKKYSVKRVDFFSNEIYIVVKEVFKKKPWPGFDGEHVYPLERFLKIRPCKTEQEANEVYHNRVCPKCGGMMMEAQTTWCRHCMSKRELIKDQYNKTHTFYYSATDTIYTVEYDDELTRTRGFDGRSFTIRVKDTGEIIHTNNLWSSRGFNNAPLLPEIEFIEE